MLHLTQKVCWRLNVHALAVTVWSEVRLAANGTGRSLAVNLKPSHSHWILLHLPCALKHWQKWTADNICTQRKEILSVKQEENFFRCFGTDVFSLILPGMLEAEVSQNQQLLTLEELRWAHVKTWHGRILHFLPWLLCPVASKAVFEIWELCVCFQFPLG